jgi:hypothetical protein
VDECGEVVSMSAVDRIRFGYGPGIAISRAISVFDQRVVTLEHPRDAVFFHAGMRVVLGLQDDGKRNRPDSATVDSVERERGIVYFTKQHPTIATGDYLFTDPPGAQIDLPRAAFALAVEAEGELLKQIGERLIALSKGKAGAT